MRRSRLDQSAPSAGMDYHECGRSLPTRYQAHQHDEPVHRADEPGIEWVEIDRIHDSPYQHSELIDPDDFAAFVASIATEGFQHALNVSPLEGQEGHYFLTSGGHQRRDAARAAGVAKIPVFVAEAPERKRLAFRAAKENTARVNTSLVNLGYLYP